MKTKHGCEIKSEEHSLETDAADQIGKFNEKSCSPIIDVVNPIPDLDLKEAQEKVSLGDTLEAKGTVFSLFVCIFFSDYLDFFYNFKPEPNKKDKWLRGRGGGGGGTV